MRKWLVFLCMFFIFLATITYILSYKKEEDSDIDIYSVYSCQDNKDKEVEIYEELKCGKSIKLSLTQTQEIIDIDLFDYLRCVVASEMPANYELEALKSQAIVARTYLMQKMNLKHEDGSDICSSSNHCQIYQDKDEIFRLWKLLKGWTDSEIQSNWKKVNAAVISTDGLVITYEGQLINAFFHASSPIKTENSDQIWGKVSYPYLVSVENQEEENYSNRESEVDIQHQYFEDKIKQCIDANFALTDKKMSIYSYTTSGRVKEVIVDGYVISAEKLRSIFGIKSTLFEVENHEDSFNFKVIGYGHGVGMSQVGANYLAINGKTYEEIIKFYYTGVSIDKMQ